MELYLDATTLIALGSIGELDLLRKFDGQLVVLPVVRDEVTTEPAATALDRFLQHDDVESDPRGSEDAVDRALELLGDEDVTGDVHLVAAVLSRTASGEPVAVVTDDRRMRTVARGLGARVTGTIGVVVRAVEDGMPPAAAKELVRRLDEQGLHMTAELRDAAIALIEGAAE